MKKIQINDLHDYHFIHSLQSWGEESSFFTFVKTQTDEEKNSYQHDLYQSDGIRHQKIYHFDASPQHFIYNHKYLLIPEKDEDKHFLKKINLETKECEKKYRIPYSISKLEKLNKEGQFIASVYHNPHKEDYDDSLFEIIETIPFQSNGSGFTQGKINQLFFVDLNNDVFEAVTPENLNVFSFALNPEKTKIFITAHKNIDVFDFYPQMYLFDLKQDTLKLLTEQKELSIGTLIPLKNRLFVTASTKKEHGVNQNADFYEFVDGEFVKVCDFGLSMWPSIGSDVRFGNSPTSYLGKKAYYFTGSYHHYQRVYAFDGQEVKVVYKSEGSIDGWIPFQNNVIAVGLKNNKLQELYHYQVKKEKTKIISSFNREALEDKYIAIPKYIQYENDGQKLDGWILYPYDYQEGKSYPAILDIHGGPKTIYTDVFYHEMQVWASEGYFVFFTNPRGGDAFGNDFADIRGQYGQVDYDDLMAFTDLVLDTFPIDRERVGVTGGSYGGFMTNWIVSHTDRFAVAATQRSISNWISFYGTSDIGYYFAQDQTDANPFTDLEKMWEQSPLKHAMNIKTPLLFIHADEDYRCPIEQAMQLYTVIKENGVETRFVWFKGENHDLSRSGRPKARIKRLEEITAWMNKYLK